MVRFYIGSLLKELNRFETALLNVYDRFFNREQQFQIVFIIYRPICVLSVISEELVSLDMSYFGFF